MPESGANNQTAEPARPKPVKPVPALSPYLAGALAGIAAVLALWAVELQFGVTPFYGYIAKPLRALCISISDPGVWAELAQKMQFRVHSYFAIGIPIGAALSAWLANDWKLTAVPSEWAKRFGPSTKRRLVWAFIGGFIALFGVRMAGGCPSGLGMSGIIGLSAGGFLGLAMFFAGGVLTAWLIYGRPGKQEGKQ